MFNETQKQSIGNSVYYNAELYKIKYMVAGNILKPCYRVIAERVSPLLEPKAISVDSRHYQI